LRRLLGLPPINLDPFPPPIRRRLDQQGYFEVTGAQETKPGLSPRVEHLILREPTISNLREESLGPYNPLMTDLSVPIVIQVKPYEHQVVSQAVMEKHVATSSGNSHTPSMVVTIGGFSPPSQSSSV
jgi:hypothetical protein